MARWHRRAPIHSIIACAAVLIVPECPSDPVDLDEGSDNLPLRIGDSTRGSRTMPAGRFSPWCQPPLGILRARDVWVLGDSWVEDGVAVRAGVGHVVCDVGDGNDPWLEAGDIGVSGVGGVEGAGS